MSFQSMSKLEGPNTSSKIEELLLEDTLKRKLKLHFKSPCEKCDVLGQNPWKLFVQVLKIILVTTQLVFFGLNNEMVVRFMEENTLVFKHLFLKDYKDAIDDTYAIYCQEDVYDHITFTIQRYLELRNISVGNHAYGRIEEGQQWMTVCKHFYKQGAIFPKNETFDIYPDIETECFDVEPMTPVGDLSLDDKFWNMTLDFNRLVSIQIMFKLKAINLQTIRHQEIPDCYDFTVTITLDNEAYSGRITVSLDNDVGIQECTDWHVSGYNHKSTNNYLMIFDAFVILTCILSASFCLQSVVQSILLMREYVSFVHQRSSKTVSWSSKMEFINGWYSLTLVSDILCIIGSILKMEIQAKSLTTYDVCSIFLGTSTLLIWLEVIGYLEFFKKYNILILTMRTALPKVTRFWCCAAMIYMGYCFCGWIVLGPYHPKFRSLNVASECLFSLVNGDDMSTTFSVMRKKNYMVWLFSRVYLYTFISLFIYMVLSLFIALITDTYETIKTYQKEGFPQSELHAFMSQCNDGSTSGSSGDAEESTPLIRCCGCWIQSIVPCYQPHGLRERLTIVFTNEMTDKVQNSPCTPVTTSCHTSPVLRISRQTDRQQQLLLGYTSVDPEIFYRWRQITIFTL
ncbi:mucolipin-3-like [Leptodactylus fuscus]